MKRKLFWIIYYVVAASLLICNAIVHSAEIHISWFSLFPIAYIALLTFWACLVPTRKWAELARQRIVNFRARCNEPLDDPTPPTVDNIWQSSRRAWQKNARIIFASIPFLIPFIYLYSNTAKYLSVLIAAAGYLAGGVPILFDGHKEELEFSAKRKKEREEQEQKEELGKWK